MFAYLFCRWRHQHGGRRRGSKGVEYETRWRTSAKKMEGERHHHGDVRSGPGLSRCQGRGGDPGRGVGSGRFWSRRRIQPSTVWCGIRGSRSARQMTDFGDDEYAEDDLRGIGERGEELRHAGTGKVVGIVGEVVRAAGFDKGPRSKAQFPRKVQAPTTKQANRWKRVLTFSQPAITP